ncbi:MAG TPA: decarboxylating 6-phosphogluconate dehydrogenase [bacterium]|nr:decarboxylating 6-phosphogluconate dehydrogenase [bacterium]
MLLKNKTIGIIGLGKMGRGMGERLLERGWRIVVYDKDQRAKRALVRKGALGAKTLSDLTSNLPLPRVVWLMVPAPAVEEVLLGKNGISHFLSKGDFVIDGGNSFYLDSRRRQKKLSLKGIHFVDVGVSGGPKGAREGACLMVGGKKKDFERLKALFNDLSAKGGPQFFPGAGAGHFVKMVHNGIEYGMMQAIAEGFNLLRKSRYKIDLEKVAEIYSRGSVIESRLIKWLKKAFEKHGQSLKGVSGTVGHTGEGEWTVKTAKKMGVPVKVIEDAFLFRVQSEKNPSYTGKILSALREQFGGHSVRPGGEIGKHASFRS